MTSDKKNVSLLVDIFLKKGLSDIIISPGSRNAPLVIAFAGNEKINARSIIDERSAAFYALGMAQQLKRAVALACTSGTALLNYAPAIAEAYYQKIPLLILSADRPPEMIDQGDGQTIRQKDVFRNFIKRSYELPVVIDDPATRQIAEQVINSAIDQTLYHEPGPVHINIPFREPLYNVVEEGIQGEAFDTIKPIVADEKNPVEALAAEWNGSARKMIIVGQHTHDPALNARLSALAKLNDVVVLTETTSNMDDPNFMDTIDNVVSSLSESEEKTFKPDLLISLGGQIVSKMVKRYLRLNPATAHWHFSVSGEAIDTYFILSRVITEKPAVVFKQLVPHIQIGNEKYAERWQQKKNKLAKARDAYVKKIPYCDMKVFEYLRKQIPEETLVHLGNSTPVRYAQLFGAMKQKWVLSNRGVSGIDGQVSTAAGAALVSDKTNVVITGDLGFFYDSNALMYQRLPANLKIIVVNNGGGAIFRFIKGPDETPFLNDFFEAKHPWHAGKIAETFDVTYFRADNQEQLEQAFPDFIKPASRPALLEIVTPGELNSKVLRDYFALLKKT